MSPALVNVGEVQAWDWSFDHLVGAGEQRRRQGKAEILRGFEIEHQLELDWGLDRKLARLLALEDAVDVPAARR
jgi:hypothetical protein